MQQRLIALSNRLEGTVQFDSLHKKIYATDASVYRKIPLAAAFPKNENDLKILIRFAEENKVSLIPRTAGTSLAGQCVGDGIVVDVSKHFTKIVHVDQEKKQVTVQPGVIRDELNTALESYGLFFGPNTSTSNRCMIGGMVGNNSSGTTSIQYGVTRDKIVAMKTILSDGSEATFGAITSTEFEKKCAQNTLEGKIYKTLYEELSKKEIQQEIRNQFPKAAIHRRNTGYAVDELLNATVFDTTNAEDFNMCKLLSGSEGTLAFTTEITLQLDVLPPKYKAMVIPHYHTLSDCLNDVAPVMDASLYLCEMMDKTILDCTKNNRAQLANRFFVEGDPEALLMLEVKAETEEALKAKVDEVLDIIATSGKSYHNAILKEGDIAKAIELRKAGLGLLGNLIGDKKAVACIEDTAVALDDLSEFIAEFTEIMDHFQQKAVYYAHAGAGELHLRPILNLKVKEDVVLFREITTEVAKLTKKYQGSFSGEHGDGIVRAEFIPLMIGEENYQLLRRVKKLFDPNCIFNPGKIVDAYKMDESLRYEIDRKEPEIKTLLNFDDTQGILRAAEQCNGSGDCRKTEKTKGAMCPSYHATKNEKDTTRARANVFREVLTNPSEANRFNNKELKEVLDLCISCKACSSECPSNVDMATLKAEFLYQYQLENGFSTRNKLFAYSTKMNKLAAKMPAVSNLFFKNKLTSGMIKSVSGIHPKRAIPEIVKFPKKNVVIPENPNGAKVVLYIDEFSQYLDGNIATDALELLKGLGYEVVLYYGESGRTFLSKGFLKQAQQLAEDNIKNLSNGLFKDLPILGIEPSAILSFRDEYKRLVKNQDKATAIAQRCFLIEEFLAAQIQSGTLTKDVFTKESKTVKIHNHCHQKALANQKVTFDVLNLPENYKVSIINSGCCGMAGSFGYEKDHYEISMTIGETRLFPAIRKFEKEVIVAANGTSCRHQIYDGTQVKALHPVTILRNALA